MYVAALVTEWVGDVVAVAAMRATGIAGPAWAAGVVVVLAQCALLAGTARRGAGAVWLGAGAGGAACGHVAVAGSADKLLGALAGFGQRERIGLVALSPWLCGLSSSTKQGVRQQDARRYAG